MLVPFFIKSEEINWLKFAWMDKTDTKKGMKISKENLLSLNSKNYHVNGPLNLLRLGFIHGYLMGLFLQCVPI